MFAAKTAMQICSKFRIILKLNCFVNHGSLILAEWHGPYLHQNFWKTNYLCKFVIMAINALDVSLNETFEVTVQLYGRK